MLVIAMLVGLSPNDSSSAGLFSSLFDFLDTHAISVAWSSTLLTMSLVIPAVLQKKQLALTLYHATLVLNFATFSSVSSLAVVSKMFCGL